MAGSLLTARGARQIIAAFGLCAACVSVSGCQPAAAPPTRSASRAAAPGTIIVAGLSAPVEVVRDRWGVAHITAATESDLFIAQGYIQASDRLFQMDLWRRSVQGRLAEVFGLNFVGRDAMTRRVQFRGDPEEDWAALGAGTKAIATAFVRGVNARVLAARADLPEEFKLAGWEPALWRPEDLLNRTDAFLGSSDAVAEVFRARLVAAVGPGRAASLLGVDLHVPASFDAKAVSFQLADLLRRVGTPPFFIALNAPAAAGSNAWAIEGRRSVTGAPIVATDPHRVLSIPALRYLVHLKAPGWNVIGAAAPWLPGVVIGHNERVAWGMTALDADTEDIYVERLNPDNPHQVDDHGQWHNTTVVQDPIWVKKGKPAAFTREYTPHGVVIGADGERHLAYTLRWTGFEPGAAGEIAALGLDRAASADELRSALGNWKTPSIDVVFADRDGVVGSQAAALVPIRRGSDGRLPVPAWMRAPEWNGWMRQSDLAHASNPSAGFVGSVNGDRARSERLREALTRTGPFTVEDSRRLQQDVRAWNAGQLVPLLARVRSPRADVERTRQDLLAWNREVTTDSAPAAAYVLWEQLLRRRLVSARVPADLVDETVARTVNAFVPAIASPSRLWFDGDVPRARDALLLDALTAIVDDLAARAGADKGNVIWGRLHTTLFSHPLAITDAARKRFLPSAVARPGYGETLLSTSGNGLEASIGASFSAIFDLADWDRSIAQNAPGQSESPDSPHYQDLARLWSAGASFPLAFSDKAVLANAESTLRLIPSR